MAKADFFLVDAFTGRNAAGAPAPGGEFRCELGSDYVELAGNCRLVISGQVCLQK